MVHYKQDAEGSVSKCSLNDWIMTGSAEIVQHYSVNNSLIKIFISLH